MVRFIIAFAIVKSHTLCHTGSVHHGRTAVGKVNLPCSQPLDLGRIYDAAKVIFHNIPCSEREIDTYIPLSAIFSVWEVTLSEIMNLYIKRCMDVARKEYRCLIGHGWMFDDSSFRDSLVQLILNLTGLTLLLSHVVEVHDCSDLPLIFNLCAF